jgi:hypothetical protein
MLLHDAASCYCTGHLVTAADPNHLAHKSDDALTLALIEFDIHYYYIITKNLSKKVGKKEHNQDKK